MNEPFCRKCLIEKLDPLGINETVRKRAELIPADEKTDEETYGKRLSACTGCKELISGTCRICGCFVELRAAYSEKHCPHPQRYW